MSTSPHTTRARAHYDPNADKVGVMLRDRYGCVMQWGETSWVDPTPGTELSASNVLLLEEEQARALYEELGRYFGGSGDSIQLRKDYDAERGRVDKMLNALIQKAAG